MANTIPVTQKPVPSSVSKDAYVLGIQDNGSGQQALYRLPINDVRGNGANDLFIIPSLITQFGVKNASRRSWRQMWTMTASPIFATVSLLRLQNR